MNVQLNNNTNIRQKQTYVLQKLGEALYTHKRLATIAANASKSVGYLDSKGAL